MGDAPSNLVAAEAIVPRLSRAEIEKLAHVLIERVDQQDELLERFFTLLGILNLRGREVSRTSFEVVRALKNFEAAMTAASKLKGRLNRKKREHIIETATGGLLVFAAVLQQGFAPAAWPDLNLTLPPRFDLEALIVGLAPPPKPKIKLEVIDGDG